MKDEEKPPNTPTHTEETDWRVPGILFESLSSVCVGVFGGFLRHPPRRLLGTLTDVEQTGGARWLASVAGALAVTPPEVPEGRTAPGPIASRPPTPPPS